MKSTHFVFRALTPLLLVFAAGCGSGDLDPVLGTPPIGFSGGAPTVTSTSPVASTPAVTGVATNARVFATFRSPMDAATLTPASFYLECPSAPAVDAAVSYNAATRVATLTPASALPATTTCLATITTAARDTNGVAMASNYTWSFVTGATSDVTAPTASAVNPLAGSTGSCRSTTLFLTFNEPMDPVSISTSTFTVTANGVAVPGTVSYDATSRQARFRPTAASGFDAGAAVVATALSGASGMRDVAGNPLAADVTWNYTAGTQACVSGVNLGTAAAFGVFGGGAGATNQGPNTVVGGSLGTTAACTLITGFHDASNTFTEVAATNIGAVSGTVTCGPPAPGTTTSLAAATQARADAQTAYNELAALPAGSDPGAGQLGGLVLAPGVYTSAGGTFAVTTGDLTLDAQGDANAVWVFQMASALTVGLSATPRTVSVINGGQAANVYWQVGSAARIEDGSTMVGTIIAPAGVTFSTPGQAIQTTLTGRALGLTASVTMVNTTIVAP
jgi:hypothetical protein